MSAGLVGPHINIVHGNNLTDDSAQGFVDLGVSFSITPENEMAQGHGHPITGRLRALGSRAVDRRRSRIRRSAATCSPWRAWRSPSQRALDNAERARASGNSGDLDDAGARGAGLDHDRGARCSAARARSAR